MFIKYKIFVQLLLIKFSLTLNINRLVLHRYIPVYKHISCCQIWMSHFRATRHILLIENKDQWCKQRLFINYNINKATQYYHLSLKYLFHCSMSMYCIHTPIVVITIFQLNLSVHDCRVRLLGMFQA